MNHNIRRTIPKTFSATQNSISVYNNSFTPIVSNFYFNLRTELSNIPHWNTTTHQQKTHDSDVRHHFLRVFFSSWNWVKVTWLTCKKFQSQYFKWFVQILSKLKKKTVSTNEKYVAKFKFAWNCSEIDSVSCIYTKSLSTLIFKMYDLRKRTLKKKRIQGINWNVCRYFHLFPAINIFWRR